MSAQNNPNGGHPNLSPSDMPSPWRDALGDAGQPSPNEASGGGVWGDAITLLIPDLKGLGVDDERVPPNLRSKQPNLSNPILNLLGSDIAAKEWDTAPTGCCSDPKCENWLFAPAGKLGANCSGCESLFCVEHLDDGGKCPSCATPAMPAPVAAPVAARMPAPVAASAAASASSLLSQLKKHVSDAPGVTMRTSTGVPRCFGVQAQVKGKLTVIADHLGSVVEGSILFSSFRFCRGEHTKCSYTSFPALLQQLHESLDLSRRYTKANPTSQLAKTYFTGDLGEVFGHLWSQFEGNCLPHLRSADDAKVAATTTFLRQLAGMTTHEQIVAQAGQISLPWQQQNGHLLCQIINDGNNFTPKASPWDKDTNVLREIPAFRRYFCGTTRKGDPAVHPAVSTEGHHIGTVNNRQEVLGKRKQLELDHLVYILYMSLAEEDSERFRSYVPDEWKRYLDTEEGEPHPPLRPDTAEGIIGQMKKPVARYLAEEGIVDPHYTLLCLEEGGFNGQYDVSPDVQRHFEQRAVNQIDTPENRERCERLMSKLHARRENSGAVKKQYIGYLDCLSSVWKLMDDYQTTTDGKPAVIEADGNPVLGGDGEEERLELEDFTSQVDALIEKSGLMPGWTMHWPSYIDDAKWSNADNKFQRRKAVGVVARFIASCLEECAGGCGRSPRNYHSRAFDQDHDLEAGEKDDAPSNIAREQGVLTMVDELKRCCCMPTCKLDHDHGENKRLYELHPSKMINILPPDLTAPGERKTARDVLVVDRVLRTKFAILLLEICARGIRSGNVRFSTPRSLVAALFPDVPLLDSLCKFEAYWWNKDESVLGYEFETWLIFERLVGLHCGLCANTKCKPEDSNFKERSPNDQTGDAWDHYKKKYKNISKLVHSNPIYLMNELCSWVVKLCPFCNAARDATQANGCAERCYDIIGSINGTCGHKKSNNPKPTRVSL